MSGGRVIEGADLRRVTVGDAKAPRVVTSDQTSARCAAMWTGGSFDWLRRWENRGPQTEALDAWWAAQKAKRQLANGMHVLLQVMAYCFAFRNWRDLRLDTQETLPPGLPWDGDASDWNRRNPRFTSGSFWPIHWPKLLPTHDND